MSWNIKDSLIAEALEGLRGLALSLASEPDTRPEWLVKCNEGTAENSRYYRFLYEIARETHPKISVELGTRTGFSAAQMAAGNPDGLVITVDTDPVNQAKARAFNLPNLVLMNADSLVALGQIRAYAPIDVLFVDSAHTFIHTSAEYIAYRELLRPNGLMLFDDIHVWHEMEDFWNKMVFDPKIDLQGLHHTGFGAAIKDSARKSP